MPRIHPTAIVDPLAELADDVAIGAYCIIKGVVRIGAGSVIHESTHIHGRTVLGRNCRVGPCAFLGLAPQHLKYDGVGTSLFVGNDVTIRELVSIHRSIHKSPDHGTRVGDRCYLMGGAHVGHDCRMGNDVILANGVLLGGHTELGDRCFIGGGAALHQFTRVGRLAIVSGNEAIPRDIPPFAAVKDRALKGYNAIGCRRAGIPRESLHAIRKAYHCIHKNASIPEAVSEIEKIVPRVPEVQELLDFIAATKRGVLYSLHAIRARNSYSYDPDRLPEGVDPIEP